MRYKNVMLFLSTIFISVSILSSPIFAVEDEAEVYPTISKKKEPSLKEEVKKDVLEDQLGDIIPTLVRKKIGKLTIDVTASQVGGYDANVNLNRYDEDGSLFIQHMLGIYGKYPLSDIFTLRSGYDFTSIKYFKFSDPDLLDNIISVGLDAKIAKDFIWSIDYLVDIVGYPHDKFSEYTMNQVGTTLRQEITDWLYQKIGYEFFVKDYPEWKTRNRDASIHLRDRKDFRNTVWHQFGLYLGERTFIKTENKIYFNDSNEQYLKYYDYMAFKTKLSVAYLITEKLYEALNFGYQYKSFHKRAVSDTDDEDQRDHLLIYGASIFYDVIPSVSIGTSFDFRKNYSNENNQAYEDYIISSGIYCVF